MFIIYKIGKIRKWQTTNYATAYFFTMSYKYIECFKVALLDHKKYMIYAILLHSFALIFIFRYNRFVHLYAFFGKILYGKTTK